MYLNGSLSDSDLLSLKDSDPAKRQLTQAYINKTESYNNAIRRFMIEHGVKAPE